MISNAALIEKFQFALDDRWGYIWGQAGDEWTKSKQKQKVDYMVSKYGTSWQKNSEAKDDNYYGAAMYGEKWIGHRVADCSGLFRWAFNEFKVYIAHGSNTIWKSYCTEKGNLNGGRRTDGKTLQPGTAVFTDKNGDKTHIGLFIGGGKVIEASGTQAGVCMSNVNATKWKCWGELKNVSYGEADTGFPSETTWRPTIRRGNKGDDVKYVQTVLYNLGYDLGSYGIDGDFGRATEAAVKEFQRDHKLNPDGVVGPLTYEELEKANRNPVPVDKKYTVCIHGLDKTQADALKNNYPGATVTEE